MKNKEKLLGISVEKIIANVKKELFKKIKNIEICEFIIESLEFNNITEKSFTDNRIVLRNKEKTVILNFEPELKKADKISIKCDYSSGYKNSTNSKSYAIMFQGKDIIVDKVQRWDNNKSEEIETFKYNKNVLNSRMLISNSYTENGVLDRRDSYYLELSSNLSYKMVHAFKNYHKKAGLDVRTYSGKMEKQILFNNKKRKVVKVLPLREQTRVSKYEPNTEVTIKKLGLKIK